MSLAHPKRRVMGWAFVVGFTALASAIAAPAATADQTLWLDIYSPLNNGFAGPVQTTEQLAPGARYLVTVTGTFSVWSPMSWQQNTPSCGTPEPAPMFPSPGTSVTGPVGLDADTAFAGPSDSFQCAAGPMPHHQSFFQIDTGSGFAYQAPVGGPYSSPTKGHQYTYVLMGTGKPVTFAFRFMDNPTSDNYGALKITIRRAGEGDCHDRGWAWFGFSDERGCCRDVDSQQEDGGD